MLVSERWKTPLATIRFAKEVVFVPKEAYIESGFIACKIDPFEHRGIPRDI